MAALRGTAGVGLALTLAAALLLPGCGDSTETLSEAETKKLLRELPYRFEFSPVDVPDGASGAVGGTAFGPHRTVVRFGVSLGRGGDPVSLGPTTDFADATGGETFRVTADDTQIVDGRLRVNPRIKTKAQWQTASTMNTAIEEKLCRATEGSPCPI